MQRMGRLAVVTLPQCIDRSNVDQVGEQLPLVINRGAAAQAGATASRWTVTGIRPGADHRQHPAQAQKAREKAMNDYPVEIPGLPSEQAINRLVSQLEPYRRITQPKFYGIDNIPDDGSLLAGNHTIYGFLDLPLMIAEIWKQRRIMVRGLGENAHYKVPVWREALDACGMVRGTRDNVRALMRDHETILVFPGGSREVFKRRGQQYQLLWRERMGFARLAIEHGYPVIPCAAVGAEDMLDVIADVDTPIYGEFARLSKKVMGFPTPPVVRGVGLTGIPRPERLYFWFDEPVGTTRFAGQDADTAARTLRDEVKRAVLAGIQFLRDERDKDPDRNLVNRLFRLQ